MASVLFREMFHIDTGAFIYQRSGRIPNTPKGLFEVFTPWGELTHVVPSIVMQLQTHGGVAKQVTNQWVPTHEAPLIFRDVLLQEGTTFKSIGIWPIQSNENVVGLIIVGRNEPLDADDSYNIGVCAAQISLVLELMIARRVADVRSKTDTLTGLLNRRGVLDEFQYLERLASDNGQALIMGLVDIDNFKSINDEFGHVRGDEVIMDVAKSLTDVLHDDKTIIGRWGGDEFLFVVLMETPDVDTLEARVRSCFRDLPVDVSVGCAVFGVDGQTWDECYHQADIRLYRSRNILLGQSQATS